jgi:hypothetical protein
LVSTSDRPLRQVARDLGLNHETLRKRVAEVEDGEGDSEHRVTFAVAMVCRVLGARRPGFYE